MGKGGDEALGRQPEPKSMPGRSPWGSPGGGRVSPHHLIDSVTISISVFTLVINKAFGPGNYEAE